MQSQGPRPLLVDDVSKASPTPVLDSKLEVGSRESSTTRRLAFQEEPPLLARRAWIYFTRQWLILSRSQEDVKMPKRAQKLKLILKAKSATLISDERFQR